MLPAPERPDPSVRFRYQPPIDVKPVASVVVEGSPGSSLARYELIEELLASVDAAPSGIFVIASTNRIGDLDPTVAKLLKDRKFRGIRFSGKPGDGGKRSE